MALKISKVHGISMGILSAEEIRNMSEGELTKISEDVSFENSKDPIYHPRQGIFPDQQDEDLCSVCGSKSFKKQCTGHPMHIDLEYPVINPILIKEVLYVLSCLCPSCKRIIYPESKCQALGIKSSGSKRIRAIQKKLKKDTICFYDDCQSLLPHYEIRNEYIYYWYDGQEIDKIKDDDDDNDKKKKKIVTNKKTALKLEPNVILNLFKQISQDDFNTLGFNGKLTQNPIYYNPDIQTRPRQEHRLASKPEDMIFTAFPIVSKIVVSQEEDNGDDIISGKYRNILKNNVKLRKQRLGKITLSDNELMNIRHKITQDVCIVVDNTSTKTSQPHNNKEMRTFAHYIKGKKNKHAIQRMNIQGKRIEANGRTVIGPGPFQKPWEIGIPKPIADVLLNEFNVQPWNIKQYQSYIDNALTNGEKIPYYIRKQRKNFIKPATKNYTQKLELQIGDVVAVKLGDGNWGHFNRQPSLRIESLQGVQTKILPKGKGFRVPLCVVTTYNADFDGEC